MHGSGRGQGTSSNRRRDFEPALAYLRPALGIFEDLQDPGRILECYHGLGDVLYVVGPLEEALATYEQALAIARSTGSGQRVPQSLFGCARTERVMGQPAAAAARLAEARELCRTIG